MKHTLIIFCLLTAPLFALAQTGIIRGQVVERNTAEPIPFANVYLQNSTTGTTTDVDGNFTLEGVEPGIYNVVASFVGYEPQVQLEVEVTRSRPAVVNFQLATDAEALEEVEVVASPFEKPPESPVSLRSLGATEVKRAPGGNRDISRVVRNLPGVASSASFRNDLIIRGGAPNENRYYLDGIEIPVINHFQTQGSSGGPVGLINVDLIQRVDFYSGAFPANRGNTLSSIFEFKLKEPRQDETTFNFIVGASDLGATLETPISKNSSLLVSARRSYLQFLFQALQLPFLPIYNDFQFKYKYRFGKSGQLTLLGIGAIDQFDLNQEANETEDQRYLLRTLPDNDQWNYTVGAKYDHFHSQGFYSFVLSRNVLNNSAIKYRNNDSSDPANLLQDYESQEAENKFRFEDFREFNESQSLTYGVNLETANFFVDSFIRRVNSAGLDERDYETQATFGRWGLFGQFNQAFFDNKLSLSLGMRMDAIDYTDNMRNMFNQFSPRFSASLQLHPQWAISFNTGRYYQLPAYTVLGFRDTDTNRLVNKDNGLKFIQNDQLVLGLEYLPAANTRISVEGFWKDYSQYPFLVEDQLSLANLGADFGVIGLDEVTSTSEGRSYGVEFLVQQRLTRGFYGLLAYTWFRSQFEDATGTLVSSAWDFRHVVSLTGGKQFGRGWEVGVRWLYSGGAPFTPFDVEASMLRQNFDVRQSGLPDWSRLNEDRSLSNHQLDIRVDKKYFFDKWTLNLFFDVQNVYNRQVNLQSNLDAQRDATGQPIVDPNNPSQYLPNFLDNPAGSVLPTLGIIVEL